MASYVGGMNVPIALGRLNATAPLARLTIDEHTLVMRTWGTSFEASLRDIDVAFQLTGGLLTPGVGVTLRTGETAYFWTWGREKKSAILGDLMAAGVRIAPERRRAHPFGGPWIHRDR